MPNHVFYRRAALFGAAVFAVFLATSAVAHDVKTDKSWWWDDAWLNKGTLRVPENHTIVSETVTYVSRDTDIPALLAMPADAKDGKRYPAVLFQHGRAGLNDNIKRHAKRVADRKSVV